MPPVFGPPSPSSRRLWSCAGSNGRTVVPSERANSDTSGPSRYSSISTEWPPSSTARPWARAASRSVLAATPLPAASPSSLTTYGAPASSSAVSSSAGPPTAQKPAVGTPAAVITCLAKALEPSICAACCDGPKQAMPASRTASATPATSGTSGPMTTRSACHSVASPATATGSAAATGKGAAITAVPALPGAQASAVTAGSECRATHSARSRAPEPITRTRTVLTLPIGAARPGTQLSVEGAHPGVLRGPRPRIGPQLLPVRLGLQLPPGGQPRRVQLPAVDRGGDRAAGLGAVHAVAEAAPRRPVGDVGVGSVHAVGAGQRQLPHARGVDEQAAAGQHVQLPGRGHVPAATVVADLRGRRDRPAGQRVGQTGLAHAGRADHRRGAARQHQGPQPGQTRSAHRADRQHVDTDGVLGHQGQPGRDVGTQIGLREDDDRRGPAGPGHH